MARYVICVNTIPIPLARRRLGGVPAPLEWRPVSREDLPAFLRGRVDDGFAEGVAWKFAPLTLDRDLPELALDNDCILWAMPDAIVRWLEEPGVCVMAEDVRPCFGQFAKICGDAPRNSGIRATPGRFDLSERLRAVLQEHPVDLHSELDEQGLQFAALSRGDAPLVVRIDEVSICSPFPPHRPDLGVCGAHFVGLNAHELPWRYYDRPATQCVREHWLRWRDDVADRVGAPRM
jgi:hypothetical protein